MPIETLLPWLLGALFGSMIFFAATVAPTVFQALPAAEGGKFLRRFFPRYYLWGILLSTACTLAAFMTTDDRIASSSCALILLLFCYARQWLMPRINRARDESQQGDTGAETRFKRLHLQSVVINALQLILLLAASLSGSLS